MHAPAKRTFLRKGEGLARFGMKVQPKPIHAKLTANNHGNDDTGQPTVPVTRKTATVKDYATVKRFAVPPETVKQRTAVNHSVHFSAPDFSDRPQFDDRTKNVSSKSGGSERHAGKVFESEPSQRKEWETDRPRV